nr:tyrosine-type recombinase/integrase [Cytobacillus solani]
MEKYTAAFGKPSLSVHKLRHSFPTRYHAEINDVPMPRRQLGHSSIETTMIYTHIRNACFSRLPNKNPRANRNCTCQLFDIRIVHPYTPF